MLGEIFGSLIGAGAGALNQIMSFEHNKQLQENQAKLNYQYAERSARNTPSWNRAGLESAGYNPMLAVQNATSGANASWASGAHADSADLSGAISQGVANAQSVQRLKNETHTADTQANLNEAQSRESTARAVEQELKNPYVDERQRKEIGKISAETANINRATEHYEAIEHNMEVMQRLQQMGINLNYASSIYGANKAYNASTYATNEQEKTKRNTKHFHTGFGTGYSGYISPDTFSSKDKPTSKYNNTGKSYHWEHY